MKNIMKNFYVMNMIESTDDVYLDCMSDVNFDKQAVKYATDKVQRDFEQGWQGIEYKLNTVGSSRGDYPFVTMTIGLATSKFGKMASITLLQVHSKDKAKKDLNVQFYSQR